MLFWIASSKQDHLEDNVGGAVAVSAAMDIHVPNVVFRLGLV